MLLARGRDVLAHYGGEDVVDVGPALVGSGLQAPEPTFNYSMRTDDRSKPWSAGSAYHVDWRALAGLEVGLQEENYQKTVDSPGAPEGRLSQHPLRAYGNSAVALTRRVTLYAGDTQGLGSGTLWITTRGRPPTPPATSRSRVRAPCSRA